MDDFSELSDEEKASSIRSKIKNTAYQMYNLELDVLMETAISEPNLGYVADIQGQIDDLQLKKSVLETKLAALSSGTSVS
jgi:hypothetical protein